eukprot:XP_016660640.1 PREDICTED: uncharacterized protein LOC107883982 [Acyrthosiphon pisum]
MDYENYFVPVISIKDLKDIVNNPSNVSERREKVEKLKEKINSIINADCWDLDDILQEYDYNDSTVFDCVVYFLAGYIVKRLIIFDPVNRVGQREANMGRHSYMDVWKLNKTTAVNHFNKKPVELWAVEEETKAIAIDVIVTPLGKATASKYYIR